MKKMLFIKPKAPNFNVFSMAGIYRPQHLERTVPYRVFFHYLDRFLMEYEDRFQNGYGFLWRTSSGASPARAGPR